MNHVQNGSESALGGSDDRIAFFAAYGAGAPLHAMGVFEGGRSIIEVEAPHGFGLLAFALVPLELHYSEYVATACSYTIPRAENTGLGRQGQNGRRGAATLEGMSILGTIGKFFSGLLPHHQDAANEVLKDVSVYLPMALTCVTAVENELKIAGNPSAVQIGKFLSKYEPDLQKVVATAQQLAALPASDLFHEAALYALNTLAPPGVTQSLLNLAVEMAYNILKASAPAPAPTPTPTLATA